MTSKNSTLRKPERASSFEVRKQDTMSSSIRTGNMDKDMIGLFNPNLRRNASFTNGTQAAILYGDSNTQSDGLSRNSQNSKLNGGICSSYEYPKHSYQNGFGGKREGLFGSDIFDTEMNEYYNAVNHDEDTSFGRGSGSAKSGDFEDFRHHLNKLSLNSTSSSTVYHFDGDQQTRTRMRSNTISVTRSTSLAHFSMNGHPKNFGFIHQNASSHGQRNHQRPDDTIPSLRSVPVSRRNSYDRSSVWEGREHHTPFGSRMPINDTRMSLYSDFLGSHHSQSVLYEPIPDLPRFSEIPIFEKDGANSNLEHMNSKNPRPPVITNRSWYSDLSTSAALDLAHSSQRTRPDNFRMRNDEWEWPPANQINDHSQARPTLRHTASMYTTSREVHAFPVKNGMYANGAPKQVLFSSDNGISPFGAVDAVYIGAQQHSMGPHDRPTSPSRNICRFFQQGHCSRGDTCGFIHGLTPPDSARSILCSVGPSSSSYNHMGSNGSSSCSHPTSTHSYNSIGTTNGKPSPSKSTNSRHAPRKSSSDIDGCSQFSETHIEEMVGKIYSLCKDQHGCRYLQKQLEEQKPKSVDIIFNEISSHFATLMIDPFGNYLCQKLLEYCTDGQRAVIMESVSSELVNISLNTHGTRAVQKMIEFLSNSEQIQIIIAALGPDVVALIKDLNGNHVIQRCLHCLNAADNQFVYNAVSENIVEVASHRHGCCVLQRCIDYSSESQKIQLVTRITHQALDLVQDPFGNYVVQYVLDLDRGRFSDSLIRRFLGNVDILSVQKFSSNVMEKCIRVSTPETRKGLVEELLIRETLDKLLRDSFGNYVVQTALDYAEFNQRVMLVDAIRPLLPAIRNSPYGKRIQGKLQRERIYTQHPNMLNLGYNGVASSNHGALEN
ncbi:hypothetical protein K7432_012068 [Basidiobolus ranarum]|uniref:Uncharacterized protein n=1 Tax=Basidiobolus ranarum TaxID=34480 RepID=A0ABR2WLH3_9FUNG